MFVVISNRSCFLLTTSGFFVPSCIPEAAKPQFAIGPQKCVVMGPVGELINAAWAPKRPWKTTTKIMDVPKKQRSKSGLKNVLQQLKWTKWIYIYILCDLWVSLKMGSSSTDYQTMIIFSCFQTAIVDPTFVQKPGPGTGPGTNAMLREATDSLWDGWTSCKRLTRTGQKSDPGGHQIWFLLDVPLVFLGIYHDWKFVGIKTTFQIMFSKSNLTKLGNIYGFSRFIFHVTSVVRMLYVLL